MEGMKDWEPVDAGGTLKRFKVPGGYVYALVDWSPLPREGWYPAKLVKDGGYWRIVNGFYVEEKGLEAERRE